MYWNKNFYPDAERVIWMRSGNFELAYWLIYVNTDEQTCINLDNNIDDMIPFIIMLIRTIDPHQK